MIVELLQFAVEGIAVVGGSLWIFRDYKQGFAGTKNLLAKGKCLLGMAKAETPEEKVNRLIEAEAQRVNAFREAFAESRANLEIAIIQVQRFALLIPEVESAQERALREGNAKVAEEAAVATVRFRQSLEKWTRQRGALQKFVEGLNPRLETAQENLTDLQVEAGEIRADMQMAEANRRVYALVSNIDREGFTPKGQLEQLAMDSQKDRISSGLLVELAEQYDDNGEGVVRRILKSARIKEELDNTRRRLALNAAPPELEEELQRKEVGQAA